MMDYYVIERANNDHYPLLLVVTNANKHSRGQKNDSFAC